MRVFSQVPWLVTDSATAGEFMRISISSNLLATKGDIVVEDGDAIGAFFEYDNKLICAGYINLDTSNILNRLVVFRDSSNTFDFNLGDPLVLRYWDNSESCIRDIHTLSARNSFLDQTNLLQFNTSSSFFLDTIYGSNVEISYQNTIFCHDDENTYLPIVEDGFNFNDDSTSYVYSSNSFNSLDTTSGAINISQINELGDFQISIVSDYCLNDDSIHFEIEDCSNLSDNSSAFFQPESNINNVFPINENAKVEVYNLRGVLVNEFLAPVNWDGKDNNGDLLPTGLYFVFLNGEKKYELTIVR